jgi:hypothetical protein
VDKLESKNKEYKEHYWIGIPRPGPRA